MVAGKITPATKDWYGKVAEGLGLAAFDEMVAAMPVIVGKSGLTTEKTATAGAAGLSADELAYCKAAGKDPVAFAKTKSEEAE